MKKRCQFLVIVVIILLFFSIAIEQFVALEIKQGRKFHQPKMGVLYRVVAADSDTGTAICAPRKWSKNDKFDDRRFLYQVDKEICDPGIEFIRLKNGMYAIIESPAILVEKSDDKLGEVKTGNNAPTPPPMNIW